MNTKAAYTADSGLVRQLLDSTVSGQRDGALPELNAVWFEKSDLHGAWDVFRAYFPLLLICGLTPLAYAQWGLGMVLISVLLIGVYVHKLTILMHDASHRTLFRSRRANEWVGEITAALLVTDFDIYTKTHMRHHRYNGTQADPEGRVFPEMVGSTRGQLLWQLFKPFFGVGFLEVIRGFPDMVDERAEQGRTRWWRWPFTLLLQGILALLASGFLTVWWLLPLFPIAAGTAGFFFSRLRGFVEHMPATKWGGRPYTRSHRRNWFDHLFFYDFGMNFHVEHHLYPSVPGYQLKSVCDHLRDTGWHSTDSLSSSVLHTLARRLREAA